MGNSKAACWGSIFRGGVGQGRPEVSVVPGLEGEEVCGIGAEAIYGKVFIGAGSIWCRFILYSRGAIPLGIIIDSGGGIADIVLRSLAGATVIARGSPGKGNGVVGWVAGGEVVDSGWWSAVLLLLLCRGIGGGGVGQS